MTNGTSLQCVELLTSGQVDLIVVNSPNSSLHNISHTIPIREFQDVFAASKTSFPELMAGSVSLQKLQSYPLLMLGKQSTTSEFLHQLFLQEHLDLAPAIELASNDLLIDLARIGLGIAFVPDFCLDDKKDSNLFVIQTETRLPSRKIIAACQNPAGLPGAANHFLTLLRQSS